jgi:hypothetical protein
VTPPAQPLPLPGLEIVAAALAALVLGLGCGGGDKEAKQRCFDDAYNAAEAAVVARAYDKGKLGSRKQVEAELGIPERPGSDYFDSEGHLIPYRKLPDDAHKRQFLLWMNADADVDRVTYDARQKAKANARPDC